VLLKRWSDEDVGFAAALAGAVISLFRLHPAPRVALHVVDKMLDVAGPLFMYLALGLTPELTAASVQCPAFVQEHRQLDRELAALGQRRAGQPLSHEASLGGMRL
jgi:hypothetical protein